MLLLTRSLAVPLDVLNNHYQPVARFDAHLLSLHGDWATLTLAANAPVSCVHWGSLVRFWISDGPHNYEAEGVVVAHSRVSEAIETIGNKEGSEEEGSASAVSFGERRAAGNDEEDSAEADSASQECREITVHLWQCRQTAERRESARRWARFGVLLRAARENTPLLPPVSALQDREAEECWERGWAVDLSAGGIRLRTHACLPVRQRLALQFALSGSRASSFPQQRRFLLYGRVLRSERTRAASSHEAMISFEHLSPEDGLALSRFLTFAG